MLDGPQGLFPAEGFLLNLQVITASFPSWKEPVENVYDDDEKMISRILAVQSRLVVWLVNWLDGWLV